jgi:inhibitor of cysteine peptidase
MDLGKARYVLLFALLALSCHGVPSGVGVSGSGSALAAAGEATRDDDKVVEIAVEAEQGKEFSITLASNRTTGYEWRLAQPVDERMVKFVKSTYAPPLGDLVGAGGQETWAFLPMEKGETEILMEYVRPWEKGGPPAKSAKITVAIEGPSEK